MSKRTTAQKLEQMYSRRVRSSVFVFGQDGRKHSAGKPKLRKLSVLTSAAAATSKRCISSPLKRRSNSIVIGMTSFTKFKTSPWFGGMGSDRFVEVQKNKLRKELTHLFKLRLASAKKKLALTCDLRHKDELLRFIEEDITSQSYIEAARRSLPRYPLTMYNIEGLGINSM